MSEHVVRAFFTEHIRFGPDFELREWGAGRWDRTEDRTHAPFGYMPPELVMHDHYELRYSPEMIADQTANLSAGDLDSYLRVLETHINMHVIRGQDITDRDELERLIDNTIYDFSPRAMELFSAVQMRALTGTEG